MPDARTGRQRLSDIYVVILQGADVDWERRALEQLCDGEAHRALMRRMQAEPQCAIVPGKKIIERVLDIDLRSQREGPTRRD